MNERAGGTGAADGRRSVARPGAALVIGALGVVYGDIGTSPLYAMRESFLAGRGIDVVEANVLGILSLVIWSLVLVITVKYLFVVMRADNEGEGGIMALYALVDRHRYRPLAAQGVLVLGIFGTALLYGDGMITPAISVLSAVEGFEVATSAFSPYVLPIAVVILVGLFSVQRRGTAAVGALFGPVMIVWFGTLAALGLVHLVQHPSVLEAFSPHHAVGFFVDNRLTGFLALGSVFLVVTGGEALYADMGHFGTRPIGVGWFALVLPSLLLNYLGQAALLLDDPEVVENVFYEMAPAPLVVPLAVLATMATVIASQALISGAFSLTTQAIALGYSPRLRVDHTSEHEIGQVYLPAVNWALLVACVGLVFGFRSSSSLASAYGVAVTMTMAITTILLYLVARQRWSWSVAKAVLVCAPLLAIDLAFFGANVFKIPSGGWFPLLVGAVLFVSLTTWRTGRDLVAASIRSDAPRLDELLTSFSEKPPARVDGTAVYLHREGGLVPPALMLNLRSSHVVHRHVVLLSVLTDKQAHVPGAQRLTITALGQGFFQAVIRVGYADFVDVPAVLESSVDSRVSFLAEDTTYFLGSERILPTPGSGMALWRERLFALMARNAGSAARFFRLPVDRVVELGRQVEI